MADTIVLAGMHILFIALSQTNFKITKVFFLLRYFNKTRVSVLFLRFPYFELQNIYKRFRICVRIPISIHAVVDLFVDIRAGPVLSM